MALNVFRSNCMFSWSIFCSLATATAQTARIEDLELFEMLRLKDQPQKETDQYGCPQPKSVLVNEHPEPENFRRIMEVRRSHFVRMNEMDNIAYADQALDFMKENCPFSDENPLIIVTIPTHNNTHQFLYAPKHGRICVLSIGLFDKPE